MPLTQKRRLSTDARREQLLTAGAQLLAERPYAEVSIEDIAAAAGVSKGLLYHYFPTKKDFIMAAIERGEGELAELTAVDPDLPPPSSSPPPSTASSTSSKPTKRLTRRSSAAAVAATPTSRQRSMPAASNGWSR